MNANTRLIFTAAAMPCDEARVILNLICRDKDLPHYEKTRRRMKRRFKASLNRVIKFAKHETIRKMHRYLHENRPLTGAEETPEHPGAWRITFNPDELKNDLVVMLQVELPGMLSGTVAATLESLGYRNPWSMPAQDVINFIARRQNLLSGVSDEVFQTIRNEVSTGLNKGESYAELANRISNAFDQIDEGRADVIAETESAAAYSYASDRAARAAGVQYKKWLHGATSKVPRPDHVAIDGLVIPMDEAYPVGDPRLMYPHDENGAAADVINCSCISIPVSSSEYKGNG